MHSARMRWPYMISVRGGEGGDEQFWTGPQWCPPDVTNKGALGGPMSRGGPMDALSKGTSLVTRQHVPHVSCVKRLKTATHKVCLHWQTANAKVTSLSYGLCTSSSLCRITVSNENCSPDEEAALPLRTLFCFVEHKQRLFCSQISLT